MYCRYCGTKLPDGARFCPECGRPAFQEVKINVVRTQQTTFGDGIKALFSKLFLFKGKSGRREFNFGLLFLFLLILGLGTIILFPEVSNITSMEEYEAVLIEMISSTDITSNYNIYAIATMVLLNVFLPGPIFRRLKDFGTNSKVAIALTILFMISEIILSPIVYCLVPLDIIEKLSIVFDLVSIFNLVLLGTCMIKKGTNQEKVEVV